MTVQRRTIGRLPVARGKWDSSSTYYKYNVVSNDGSSFMSVKEDSFSGSNYEPTVELDGTNFKIYFGGTLQDGTNDVWQLMSYGRDANLSVRYVECDSAAGSNKTLNITGFELTTNMRYLIKMDNVNTIDNATLNISDTGAKLIMYNGSAASSTNSWIAGEVLDVYYDGTNYVAITFGGAKFATGERLDTIGIDHEITDSSNKVITSNAVKEALSNVAYKDGDYSEDGLVATEAKNLTGDPLDITDSYPLKMTALDPTGEPIEVADGRCKMNVVEGRGVSWNQMFVPPTSSVSNNGVTVDFDGYKIHVHGTKESSTSLYIDLITSVTYISGHKYFIDCPNRIDCGFQMQITGINGNPTFSSANVFTANSNGSGSVLIRGGGNEGAVINWTGYINIIDLTLLNASLASKSNLTVAEVEAYLATLRTPQPYYAQNAGTLLGAKMLGWKLPKTPNLLNPTTGKAELPTYSYNEGGTNNSNKYEITGLDNLTDLTITFTPYKTGIALTVAESDGDITITNDYFTIPEAGVLQVTGTGDKRLVCVKAVWDGSKKGEHYTYELSDNVFDSSKVYHKSGDVYTQVFQDGIMRATGDGTDAIRDRLYTYLDADGNVKCGAEVNVGDVDLGTLENWNYLNGYERIYASVPGMSKGSSAETASNILCNRYATGVQRGLYSAIADKSVCKRALNTNADIIVKDTAHSSAPTAQDNWVSGIKVFFELATPVTYTSDLYYKTSNNEYIPLEDVFPILAQCCNWSTEENVVEDLDNNGQPVSIVPRTTEQFQSDIRELINTIKDTMITKEAVKGSFENLATAIASLGTLIVGDFNSDGEVTFSFTPAAQSE